MIQIGAEVMVGGQLGTVVMDRLDETGREYRICTEAGEIIDAVADDLVPVPVFKR